MKYFTLPLLLLFSATSLQANVYWPALTFYFGKLDIWPMILVSLFIEFMVMLKIITNQWNLHNLTYRSMGKIALVTLIMNSLSTIGGMIFSLPFDFTAHLVTHTGSWNLEYVSLYFLYGVGINVIIESIITKLAYRELAWQRIAYYLAIGNSITIALGIAALYYFKVPFGA